MILYTASELRTALRTLDAAIVAGVKTIVIGDETINYQDTGDMIKARGMFADQLATAEGSARDRVSLAVFGND